MFDVMRCLLNFGYPAIEFFFVLFQLCLDLFDVVLIVVAFPKIFDYCQTLHPKLIVYLYGNLLNTCFCFIK